LKLADAFKKADVDFADVYKFYTGENFA